MSRSYFHIIFFLTIQLLFTNLNAQWVLNKGYLDGPIGSFVSLGPNIIVATNGSGLLISNDTGVTWARLNNGLSDTYFNCFAINDENLFAGAQTGIYHSNDNGMNWEVVNNGIPSSQVLSIAVIGQDIIAATADHLGNNIIYLSSNNGKSWIGAPFPYKIETFAVEGKNLFAGTVNGGIYLSTDNGITWNEIGLQNYHITSLVVNESNIYAGTWGDGTYLSTDSGKTWKSFNLGLTTMHIKKLLINDQYVFAATSNGGVFISTLNGTSWTPFNTGFNITNSYISVMSIFVKDSIVYAGLPALKDVLYTRSIFDIELIKCTLSISTNPANIGSVVGSGVYTFGTKTLTKAIGSDEYEFLNWTENGIILSTDANYQFIINSDRNIVANYLQKPIAPIATNATQITQSSLNANWKASASALGYNIDVAIDNQFKNILSTYNNRNIGNLTTWQIIGLTPSTTFYYRLRSYNTAGTSANSNSIVVTTLSYPPAAPVALAASNKTQNSFVTNWSSVTASTGYLIDIAIDKIFTNKLSNYDNKDVGNTTSYQINGLAANMTYYYRVRAYNNGGISINSNAILVELVTGIEKDSVLSNTFNLYQNYPNPFNPKTIIPFSIPKNMFVRLTVFNSLGQRVVELVNQELGEGAYSVNFDASQFSNGTYIYKLETEEFSESKKMILLK
ncbi:MAG: fibronectin type III domain-containing protein [Melioribacteraceae bacterium]